MSFNPSSELRYRFRLARDHLWRAEKSFSVGDWVGTVSNSQLALENFVKAVISVFEVPTWSHDPSDQLRGVVQKLPGDVKEKAEKLVSMVRELAPEHGRSAYGEPSTGLVPSDIYKEDHAEEAMANARKAREIAETILARLVPDFTA